MARSVTKVAADLAEAVDGIVAGIRRDIKQRLRSKPAATISRPRCESLETRTMLSVTWICSLFGPGDLYTPPTVVFAPPPPAGGPTTPPPVTPPPPNPGPYNPTTADYPTGLPWWDYPSDGSYMMQEPWSIGRSNPAGGGLTSANTTSPSGIQYFDGSTVIDATDLSSNGFGTPWSQSRSFDPLASSLSTGHGDNGNNWDDTGVPRIVVDSSSGSDVTLIATSDGTNRFYFDSTDSGGTFVPRGLISDQLTYNGTSNTYILSDRGGGQTVFYGFGGSIPSLQQGEFKSYADPAGNLTTTTYAGSGDTDAPEGRLKTIVRQNAGDTENETWQYIYTSTTDTPGNLAEVQWLQNGSSTPTRTVVYSYYDGSGTGGSQYDLKSAVVTAGDDSAAVIDGNYYRYYKNEEEGGYTGAIKYTFSYASYMRAMAYGYDPTSDSSGVDANVAPFADSFYQYDGFHRVIKQKMQGWGTTDSSGTGNGTYTFAYYSVSGGPDSDYNDTAYKTEVNFKNDAGTTLYTQTVYSNFAGEVLLDMTTDVSDSGNSSLDGANWGTVYKYDSAGRVLWTAEPSALGSLSGADSDGTFYNTVVNSSSGLIYVNQFYTDSTTATSTAAGGVTGYLWKTFVQQGSSGTPVLQEQLDYFAHSYTPTGSSVGDTIFPIADDTVYGAAGGSDARKTSYVYTYQLEAGSGTNHTNRFATMTTYLPAISTDQNGPSTGGTPVYDTLVDTYDVYGRITQHTDGAGDNTAYEYDDGTGAITQIVDDAGSGHLNLTTTYAVDGLGRVTEVTDPNFNYTYIVYDDADHESRMYTGWNASAHTATGPVQVSRTYYPAASASSGQRTVYYETLTSSAAPSYNESCAPTGDETISAGDIESLSRALTNNANQISEIDDYFSMSGITYSQAVAVLGSSSNNSSSGNYHATTYGYNQEGTPDLAVEPTTTINKEVYDNLGRVVSEYIGTSSSNMMDVQDDVYDAGGVGDGNLTQVTQHVDSDSADDRVSQYLYDWRDRQVAAKAAVQSSESTDVHRPIAFTVLDNLGESIASYQYDADGVALGDFGADATSDTDPTAGTPVDAGKLRAKTTAAYDDQGRVYQLSVFSVDQGETGGTAGTVGDAITTNTFYDHRGNVMAVYSTAQGATKYSYDGADRLTTTSATDGGAQDSATMNWTNASSVADDVVLSQMLYTHDNDGNVIFTADKERFDNDSNGSYGNLGGPSSGIHARVYQMAYYYDAADRLTDAVNVGTDGGSSYSRPGSAPSSSDTVLVTHSYYDAAGNVADTVDPRGIETEYSYDMLGRITESVLAYDYNASTTRTNDSNQTTDYTYDGNNDVLTETAVMPSGTDNQTTAYIYGIGSTSGTDLFSDDILSKVEYPNASTGAAGTAASDDTSYTYDLQGEAATYTDQNGTTHTYSYDVLGRETLDSIAVASGNPAGVDLTVQSLGYSYDTGGRLYQATSYSNADGTGVVNQVQYAYNGLGQETNEWQEHHGAVNTESSAQVQYGYDTRANDSRLTDMIYPNGRQEDYLYDGNSGIDNNISRVSEIADDYNYTNGCGPFIDESYTYLGLDTVVQRTEGDGQTLSYIQQSGDTLTSSDGGDRYTGLDRFGRIIDQNWVNTGTDVSIERFQYGYDRDGDILYKDNLVAGDYSELYHVNSGSSGDNNVAYDPFGRLTHYERGALSASGHNGSGLDTVSSYSAANNANWGLDALGNWTYSEHDDETADQTTNSKNEVTGVSSHTLTYDANGNMTTDEAGNTYTYDAWNRLVTPSDGLPNGYDALGRRTGTPYTDGDEYYYSADGHMIDANICNGIQAQYVWSLAGPNELVLRDSTGTSNTGDESLGIEGSPLTQRLYLEQDANENVTAIVNPNGAVAQHYIYDPYGAATVINSDYTDTATDGYGMVFLYQGGMLDPNTGMYHFGSPGRDYSVSLGRWTETDPLTYIDGMNDYEAMLGNPVKYSDPSGFDTNHCDVGGATTQPTQPAPATQPSAPVAPTYPLPPHDPGFHIIGRSVAHNRSSKSILVWNSKGWGILPAGQDTPSDGDDADYVLSNGKWYKIPDGETAEIGDGGVFFISPYTGKPDIPVDPKTEGWTPSDPHQWRPKFKLPPGIVLPPPNTTPPVPTYNRGAPALVQDTDSGDFSSVCV